MIALEASGLRAGYGSRDVLSGIDLTFAGGERVGIIGPNGSGKTTLLRCLSGTIPARTGAVRLDGAPLERIPPRVRARRIAVVPQMFSTPFAFTVREVATLGRASYVGIFGRPSVEDRRAVERALERTACIALADRPITQLSGGERQRAMIAMALAQEPDALLLDEPTVHLDPAHQRSALDLMTELAREGLLVLAVLHDLNLAAVSCGRIVAMSEGRVVRDGHPNEVIEPATMESVFGGGLDVGVREGVPFVLPGR